jgi:CheY-like chemotaxis protein
MPEIFKKTKKRRYLMATSTAIRGEGPFKKSTIVDNGHFANKGKLGNRDVRILYVEDNGTLQKILKNSFKKLEGFHFEVVSSCEDASSLVTKGDYNIIILDENLGSKNKTGSVFAREIRESFEGKIIHYSTEDKVNLQEDIGPFDARFDKRNQKKELVEWVKKKSLEHKDTQIYEAFKVPDCKIQASDNIQSSQGDAESKMPSFLLYEIFDDSKEKDEDPSIGSKKS